MRKRIKININCFKGVIAPKTHKQWKILMKLLSCNNIIVEGKIIKVGVEL